MAVAGTIAALSRADALTDSTHGLAGATTGAGGTFGAAVPARAPGLAAAAVGFFGAGVADLVCTREPETLAETFAGALGVGFFAGAEADAFAGTVVAG